MFREMLKLLTKTGKRDLIISSVFFALYGLSSIAMIVIVFSILFQIFDGTSLASLYKYFIAFGLLVVFKGICNMVADMKKHSAGFDIVQQIRERMIIKLKKFSLGFYTNERLGEINTILHKDVDNMSLVVGHMWSRMFGDFLIGAVVFIGLASIDLKLAILMAVSVPIVLIFLYLTIKQSEKIENQNNSVLLDMVSLFVEYVRGIPVLKSFSNNKSLDNELMNKTKKFGETSKAASRFKAKQLSIFGFLLDIGYLVLLIAGAILVIKGNLDVLNFIIFAVISKEFYKPFASITNLLLRFYDVHKRKITLGGTDIRDIPYDELLDRISIVMQNVQLFDNTIEENIRVGKKGATKEEIIKAAKKARIHDFIMSLPKGYETDIGENGGILSGGQRQRISIARAFLKDAPILILDEMTSNVDPVNESLIQDAITELAKNRTVLVVAHHLKTIQKADQILVFQKGNLLEKGKHGELLAKNGYYTKLWKAQYEV